MISEEKLRQKLRILGARGVFDILYSIRLKPKYMKEIAEETGIPYTTTQKRIKDLAEADLVDLEPDTCRRGKYVVKVRAVPFNVKVNPEILIQLKNGVE